MPETRFDRMALRHKDAVYRQMIRVCGNHEDAEDVLVEALMRAYQHIDQLEDPEQFRSWLATIGKRVCYRIKKKEGLAAILSLEDVAEPSTEPDHDAGLLHEQINSILENLPKGLSDVYRLRDLQGLSGEETAARLGITVEAMKSRLHRARIAVRNRIGDCVSC